MQELGESCLGVICPGSGSCCAFFPPLSFSFFFPFPLPGLFLCFVSWFRASGPGTWGAGMGAAGGCSLVSAVPLSHAGASASPMLELVPVLPGTPRAAVLRHPQSHLTQYTLLRTAGFKGEAERGCRGVQAQPGCSSPELHPHHGGQWAPVPPGPSPAGVRGGVYLCRSCWVCALPIRTLGGQGKRCEPACRVRKKESLG